MMLLGREVTAEKVLERIEDRLRERGLLPPGEGLAGPAPEPGVEPRVEPLSYNLRALEEHADPTVALPLPSARGGAGQAVQLARWALRKTAQVFIDEALSRQRLFNGHVRDSYAQLSAEVVQLRAEVARLKAAEAAGAAKPATKPAERPVPPRPPRPPPPVRHAAPSRPKPPRAR